MHPDYEPVGHGVPDAVDPPILGTVVGIALASPRDLLTTLSQWPVLSLSDDGDYRDDTLLVRRRPDDPVGQGGLAPVLAAFDSRAHDYRLAWHEDDRGTRVPGGFWGISGPGWLCTADSGSGVSCP